MIVTVQNQSRKHFSNLMITEVLFSYPITGTFSITGSYEKCHDKFAE